MKAIQVYDGDGRDSFAPQRKAYIVGAIGPGDERPTAWVEKVQGGLRWCDARSLAMLFTQNEAAAIAGQCQAGNLSMSFGYEPA